MTNKFVCCCEKGSQAQCSFNVKDMVKQEESSINKKLTKDFLESSASGAKC